MTDHKLPSAADLLHLRGRTLAKGDPIALPLTMSTMYHVPGDPTGYPSYGRSANATWEAVEKLLGHLEGAEAVLFPSGMAAIAAPFVAFLSAGDRVLLPSDGYYATRVLADTYLKKLGVTFDLRPTAQYAAGGFAGYRMVYVETPSNPGLDLCDLAAIATAARAAGAMTVADNTTMTPYGQRPLDLGIDLVVASDTKAPGGHSDILLGHVAGRDAALVGAVREWRRLSGSIPGPFEAWLLHRSLETLELRFDRMCNSAEVIAERLAAHPKVGFVRFPGLPSDPAHNLARQQMIRSGLLIGLTLGSNDKADAFIDACPMLRPATSLGGVHSSAERRDRWGDTVAPGFVRLSVGCEPVEELWAALDRALLDTQ